MEESFKAFIKFCELLLAQISLGGKKMGKTSRREQEQYFKQELNGLYTTFNIVM